MKMIIGIYCGPESYIDEESILNNGAGGSETWACEIARTFQGMGFHVIVFSGNETWKFAQSGVEYVPASMFNLRCSYQHFDYFISSRRTDELSNKISCNNIYIMSHDVCLWYCDKYEDLKFDLVKKIACLSEYHKWANKNWYQNKIQDNKIFLTANGVDDSLYHDIDLSVKQNYMVWSSRQERGLLFLAKDVLPKIRKKIPNFKIKVCLYASDLNEEISKCNGVEFLGKIGKRELSELQSKAKIWIYPNLGYYDSGEYQLFQETFCITAVENGMAKNAIICGNNGGLRTTLNGLSGLIGRNLYTDSEYGVIRDDKKEEYGDILASIAVKLLSDEKYFLEKSLESYNICKKYTWNNAAKTWLSEWGFPENK